MFWITLFLFFMLDQNLYLSNFKLIFYINLLVQYKTNLPWLLKHEILPHTQKHSSIISFDFSLAEKQDPIISDLSEKIWFSEFYMPSSEDQKNRHQMEKSVLKYNESSLMLYCMSNLTRTEFGEIGFLYCLYCVRHNISLMQLTSVLVYFSNSLIILLPYFMVVIKK